MREKMGEWGDREIERQETLRRGETEMGREEI
jgi:hypothetical protein